MPATSWSILLLFCLFNLSFCLQAAEEDQKLTVILPCAGKGTRLALPYPKEMHMVGTHTALIDLSMEHMRPYADKIKAVVMIIEPDKEQLVKYMGKWREHFRIHFCFFGAEFSSYVTEKRELNTDRDADNRHYEWAGSILSAELLFGERNLVLLPDSRLVAPPESPLVPSALAALEKSSIVFGYMNETREERLRVLGALKVEADSSISAFCDKPNDNLERFNAFWGCFGFKQKAARSLLNLMMKSIAREPVDLQSLHQSVGSFPLLSYFDLGTWRNLADNAPDMRQEDPRKCPVIPID